MKLKFILHELIMVDVRNKYPVCWASSEPYFDTLFSEVKFSERTLAFVYRPYTEEENDDNLNPWKNYILKKLYPERVG